MGRLEEVNKIRTALGLPEIWELIFTAEDGGPKEHGRLKYGKRRRT